MIDRPQHLPDFASPPVDEVFLGVQFAPPRDYSSVVAKDIWGLFQKGYPRIQEHQALDPTFETFGGLSPQPKAQFRVGTAPLRGRLWFISEEQNDLVQFQEDRFFLNWRKRPTLEPYPRFEVIADTFRSHLNSLEKFFIEGLHSGLDINQAEISYINIIPVKSFAEAGDYLRSWPPAIDIENLNLQFSEVIHDASKKPYARLVHEVQSVVTIDTKQRAIRFSLTFRGKPSGNQIADAMVFLCAGRERIVTRFSELTTERAHLAWERKQ